MAFAPSEDSDQPGRPISLIKVFAVRMKKVDAQADLSLRWAQMPFCWFCREATHVLRFINRSIHCHLADVLKFISRSIHCHLAHVLRFINRSIIAIWQFGTCITRYCYVIERVQFIYLKYVFKLKKSTPSHMIFGELGILPVSTEIQTRVASFWCKLIENHEYFKFSSLVYAAVRAMHEKQSSEIQLDWKY